MIPSNITRAYILEAIEKIDIEGTPKNRQSRTFDLVQNERYYSPKYVISLACKFANGAELQPSEFGGGHEANGFLQNLGFVVIPHKHKTETSHTDCTTPAKASLSIVTVTLQNDSSIPLDNVDRLELLKTAMDKFPNSHVILFPAGFFDVPCQKQKVIQAISDEISDHLQAISSETVVCVGIDCDHGNDQLAMSVNGDGTLAIGRKFHPTKNEKGYIRAADSFNTTEMGFPRIFDVLGEKFYLAVCYDGFGIRHCDIPNPGVNVVLVLAHMFCERGTGPSGDVDFARKGFAGASQQWSCPVFGTAVFFDRDIPENWPTGVLWRRKDQSVKNFKYCDNQLKWKQREQIKGKKEIALCYSYSLDIENK
jgi:hypothetical protein